MLCSSSDVLLQKPYQSTQRQLTVCQIAYVSTCAVSLARAPPRGAGTSEVVFALAGIASAGPLLTFWVLDISPQWGKEVGGGAESAKRDLIAPSFITSHHDSGEHIDNFFAASSVTSEVLHPTLHSLCPFIRERTHGKVETYQ